MISGKERFRGICSGRGSASRRWATRGTIETTAERNIDFLGSLSEAEKVSRADTTDRLPPSALVYDAEQDVYVCPAGQLLGYDCWHTPARGFAYYRYDLPPRF